MGGSGRLWFRPGSSVLDFEAFCDLPKWWNATPIEHEEMFVRFKAYCTRESLNPREAMLHDKGFEFDCRIDLQREAFDGTFEEWELAVFPARNREEAMYLLELAADALYE